MMEIRMPASKGVAGWVATHAEPLLVQDAYADSRFNTAADGRTGFRTRDIIAVPIMEGNVVHRGHRSEGDTGQGTTPREDFAPRDRVLGVLMAVNRKQQLQPAILGSRESNSRGGRGGHISKQMQPDGFRPLDVVMLGILSTQAAALIQRARRESRDKARRQARDAVLQMLPRLDRPLRPLVEALGTHAQLQLMVHTAAARSWSDGVQHKT